MPHDRKGKPLKVGDRVTVSCVITDLQTGTDYCNITLKTNEVMFPGNDKTTLTLNTHQVDKEES